jgi:putative endonuclease
MHFVYVLMSERNHRFYIGCTSNLQRRIDEHNNGKVRSTKAFVPWTIIFIEKYTSKTEAFKREKQLKSYKGGKAFKELLKKSERWQSPRITG